MLRTALFLVLIAGIPAFFPSLVSAAPAPVYHYERLFYYRDSPTNKKDFFAHASSIDIFAPQVYSLYSDGILRGTLTEDLVTFAHTHRIKIMPLVTNGSFNIALTVALLADEEKQAIAIASLIREAQVHDYSGWQFDFEQIPVAGRDLYSSFIKNAAQRFHEAGLELSVAVVSKVSDNPADYKGKLWVNLIGAYDYDALAASADFISVMSYDDPESIGPVVEISWLKRVLTYSLAHIPAHKLSLGIPLYYWKWNDSTRKLIGVGGNEGLLTLFKTHPNASMYYDTTYQAPSVSYTSNGYLYTTWYENARSIAVKIALVKKYKLQGASFWALGLERPGIFDSIKE